MATDVFSTDASSQFVVPSVVTCSICGHTILEPEAIRYEIMEALDGNEQNLSPENIRLTGEVGYECDRCIAREILLTPAISMTSETFKRGYHIGMSEVKKYCFTEALTDDEIVASLKTMFADYAEKPDEEALLHGIGGLVGLVTGLATMLDPMERELHSNG